jgi:hypothetical protein
VIRLRLIAVWKRMRPIGANSEIIGCMHTKNDVKKAVLMR